MSRRPLEYSEVYACPLVRLTSNRRRKTRDVPEFEIELRTSPIRITLTSETLADFVRLRTHQSGATARERFQFAIT